MTKEKKLKTVANNTVVTLSYTMADPDGNLLDDGAEQMSYLHGGYDGIFITIEEALAGKSVGDSVTVKLQPGEAFGEYDTELVQIEPLKNLPDPLKIGMMIEAEVADGSEGNSFFYTVTEIAEGKAVLDGNHPLAGIALLFNCTVAAIRLADAEEIAARHPL